MIQLVFWTCIQLEKLDPVLLRLVCLSLMQFGSEIPAELDFFTSGIIEMSDIHSEHFRKSAVLVNSKKQEDRMIYHSAQVQLCIILHSICPAVYQNQLLYSFLTLTSCCRC